MSKNFPKLNSIYDGIKEIKELNKKLLLSKRNLPFPQLLNRKSKSLFNNNDVNNRNIL